MSDKKISQLTAATTADGTEPLPIVQSGETKKATGKVVVSGAVSDLAQTWNAAGTTFTGLKLNVTDTASASGSLLLDVQKGGTSQLVLNKSGNLGLGVVPSAWSLFVGVIDQSWGSLASTTNQTNFTFNAYWNGTNWIHVNTGWTSQYRQSGGAHTWYTGSGSLAAGSTSVFTERASVGSSSFVINDVGADYDTRIEGDTDANLLFVDASTDRVGIGTNTPTQKLDVLSGNINLSSSYNIGWGGSQSPRVEGNASTNVLTFVSNSAMAWTTNNNSSTAMRLDSSGNLGLGVTPSAWTTASSIRAMEFNGGALFSYTNESFEVVQNVFYDGSWKYKATNAATRFVQYQGAHVLYTAPSGTSGTAATFTERATIGLSSFIINDVGVDYDFRIEGDTDANLFFVDASTDRVGIGTNAPISKLHVAGGGVRVNRNGSDTDAAANSLYIADGNNSENFAFLLSGSGTKLSIINYSSAGVANWRSRFTYDSVGNFGILPEGNSDVAPFAFGTSAKGVLGIKNGTAPTTGPADTIQIYSSDVSAGNTTLSIYTEGTPVSDSTDNAVTKKIAVRINGTLYYLLADTDNS